MRKALITGITGQDGSYLAELLLRKGYEVHGIIRRASSPNTGRIDHVLADLKLYYGDLTDPSSLYKLLERVEPDEIYNLAAQSHVAISFNVPQYTLDVNAEGVLCLLEAVRETHLDKVRFYQASSSELFGKTRTESQNEETPFYPRSPYGVAKLCAYWLVVNYREAYGLFACNGILFNHESPRRGVNFVTKKIAAAVGDIVKGKLDRLTLGNLYSTRDWGYAPEYVEAMWAMLQQDQPGDYVVATGETHSVKEFIDLAFAVAGMDLRWHGEGLEEYAEHGGRMVVAIDGRYYRPTEVDYLCGDASKARGSLAWEPRVRFGELVRIMTEHELPR